MDFYGEFKIGEFIGRIAEKIVGRFTSHEVNCDDAYVFTVDGKFKVIGESIYNMTLNEADGLVRSKSALSDYLLGFKVGDYVCDLLDIMGDNMPSMYDGSSVRGADGNYAMSGDYATVLALFVNKTVSELKNGVVSDGIGYLLADDMLGGLRVGNFFGKGRYCYVSWTEGGKLHDVWYTDDAQTDVVTFDSATQKALMTTLYRTKISTLTNMDIEEIFGDLYVGALSGFTCGDDTFGHIHDGDCVWLNERDVYVVEDGMVENVPMPIDPLDACIAGVKIGDVLNGALNIKALISGTMLGELFGYTAVATDDGSGNIVYDWYRYKTTTGANGAPRYVTAETNVDGDPITYATGAIVYDYVLEERASELYQAISDIDASDLFSGDAINTIMDRVKNVKFGYLMNYYFNDANGKWYSDRAFTQPVTGKKGLLCGFTINELADGSAYAGWYIGDLMELYEDEDGVWWQDSTKTVPAKGVIGMMAKLTVGDVSSSTGFRNRVNGWYIGEILECKKYDADGNILADPSQPGVWKKDDVEITDSLNILIYDYTVGELMNADLSDLIEGWSLGTVMGYHKDSGGVWRKSNDDPVTDKLVLKVVDMTIGSLASDFTSTINGWYIGDLMGLTLDESTGVWKNSSDVEATGVIGKMAALTVGQVSSENGFRTIVNEWYIGEIFECKKYDALGNLIDPSENGVWKKGDDVVDARTSKFYDYQVKDFIDGDFSAIVTAIISDWEIGLVMGYEKDGSHWVKKNENGDVIATADAKIEALYDYTVSDLIDGDFSKIVSDVIADWKIGEVMGYEKDGSDWVKKENDVVIATADRKVAAFYDYTVDDLVNGDFNNIITSIVSDWYIGEVMGYKKYDGAGDELDDYSQAGVWKKNDVPADDKVAPIYDYKISALTSSDNIGGMISGSIADWYIGTVLGYKKYAMDGAVRAQDINGDYIEVDGSDAGKWFNGDTQVAKVNQIISDKKVSDLSGNLEGVIREMIDEVIGGYALGELLGYYQYGGDWYTDRDEIDNGDNTYSYVYDPADKVTGVMGILADITVDDIRGGFIEDLTLGKLMGYTKEAGVWKKAGVDADELTAVLADYKISDITEDGFVDNLVDDIKTNVSVGAFFDTSSADGFMSLVDPDWKIGSLESNVNAAIASATVEDMIAFGAFGDYYAITDSKSVQETETANYESTDKIFMQKGVFATEAEARAYWLDLETDAFMGEVMTIMTAAVDVMTDHEAYFAYQNAGGTETYSAMDAAYDASSRKGARSFAETVQDYADYVQDCITNMTMPQQYTYWIGNLA